MSLFAVLHASDPVDPRAALAFAFPDREIPAGEPCRVVTAGVDATCVVPGRPHFLASDVGFDPAVTLHFVLDKAAPTPARAALAGAVRAFLGATDGRVAVRYGDIPVVARTAGGTRVRRGYEDLVGPAGGYTMDDAVETLVAWSHAMCAAGGAVTDVVEALDLPGAPTVHGDWQASGPPPWATAVTVYGRGAGAVNHVDVTLAAPIARAGLDVAFGPGRPLPRVHPGDAHRLGYDVDAGGPFTCAVFAAFATDPDAEGAIAHAVMLRPDRSS
jgi:hypothetical protein